MASRNVLCVAAMLALCVSCASAQTDAQLSSVLSVTFRPSSKNGCVVVSASVSYPELEP